LSFFYYSPYGEENFNTDCRFMLHLELSLGI
jgi:hypothetical protein